MKDPFERDMALFTDASLVFFYGYLAGFMTCILLFFIMAMFGVL